MHFCHPGKAVFRGCFWTKRIFPAKRSTVAYSMPYKILKAMHLRLKMKFLEAILVHPVRRQNFAGKMHLRFYNIWDCVIFSFILPRGYYDELNQCKCIYPRWQWHHQSPAGVHDDQCRVKDLLEESQCRQSSTWSTWDNSQNWRKLFKTRLVTRVFRFTSKLEFCLVAWGAHAYRYDRATDQKKIYRPINNTIPAIFVFNGNLWEFQWGNGPILNIM